MSYTPINTDMRSSVDPTLPVTSTSAAAAVTTSGYDSDPFIKMIVSLSALAQLMQEALSLINDKMQSANLRARSTKDMANRMDKVIADISKDDEKAKRSVPTAVYTYMKENGILVDGKKIEDYLDKNPSKGLNKGELTLVQASLDNSFNADTDLLKQTQIQFEMKVNTYQASFSGAKSYIDKRGQLLNDIVRI
ncbi:Secreted effector protein SseB [Sodalis glossinidius str. 'morsitans']|uniref:Secreted effector protein n=1 Tax=Sodalis glossinidius (strain morsitans) TaxID=343509 RepID=Q2NTG4_SODGM|nr:secreted effector protein [Sodalis glossinidius]BAE74561.1 putative secreted effector protein [Sodalis glossinidius str. 'morsitans']CRL45282.1 Secreted effector protein SseB [Sodalis glossinidius str. 'morsitans']